MLVQLSMGESEGAGQDYSLVENPNCDACGCRNSSHFFCRRIDGEYQRMFLCTDCRLKIEAAFDKKGLRP